MIYDKIVDDDNSWFDNWFMNECCQYAKLRERQRQAHVIWTAATSRSSPASSSASTSTTTGNQSTNPVTNLLAGRKPLLARRPSASSQSSGTRLRLPPARVVTTHPSGSKVCISLFMYLGLFRLLPVSTLSLLSALFNYCLTSPFVSSQPVGQVPCATALKFGTSIPWHLFF